METKQINMKIPVNLFKVAQTYADTFGFRNIQELINESMREKIFEKNEFDLDFSNKEINLIDNLISSTIKNKDFITEEELFNSLK